MPAKPQITSLPPSTARRYLGLLIGLQTLLAIVVIAGVGYNIRQQRDKALAEHLSQASLQVRGIENHFTQSLYLASLTLANLPELVSNLDQGEAASARNALERIQRQFPTLRSLSLADQQGDILISSVSGNVGRKLDFAPFQPIMSISRAGLARFGVPWEGRDFQDGHASTAAHPVGPRANMFMPLALTLPGESGLVAVAALNIDYFLDHAANNIDKAYCDVSIYDYNGVLVLSTRQDVSPGRRLNDGHLLARARQEEIGQVAEDEYQGRKVLTAFRTSRSYPFVIVARVDQDNALAKWREETRSLTLGTGVTLAATLLVTGLLTLRLRGAADKEARFVEAQRLAAGVFEHSNDGIIVTDAERRILAVNPAFERITGYSESKAVGATPRILSSGMHGDEFYADMWRQIDQTGRWQGEIINRRKDGSILHEWLVISSIHDSGNQVTNYVGVFMDISEMRRNEQTIRQLERVAHYDALTGLPNRLLLADRLRQAMAHAVRTGNKLGIAYLDLDGFKAVNDTHGHDIGDRLLAQVAMRMKQSLRESDTLARLGGDEFAVIMIDISDRDCCVPQLDRLLAAASQEVKLDELSLHVSASIGITCFPQPGIVDPEQLWRQADHAMYRAKQAGRNRYQFYDADWQDTPSEGRDDDAGGRQSGPG
jgi:diguanylate cyclase (GGDEF)-like protein/PAS domain S-box-containing protein